MNIELKLFMQFKNYLPSDSQDDKAIISLKEGATVDDLLKTIGIPNDEPKLLVINGVSQGTTTDSNTQVLKDRDVVSIFPPVGGG